MAAMLRPTWFEIDLDAAAENLRIVRALIGPERRIFAVVKADGYGFGTLPLGRLFSDAGADALAVADLGDGIRLRNAGIALPILVFPNALPEAALEMIGHDLLPALTELDAARAYSDAASETVPVFVKIDVGLQRLGVPAEQAVKVVREIAELPRLRVEGLCTHLHVPSRGDRAYLDWQFQRFTAVVDGLAAHGLDVPVRLAASSPLVGGLPHTYLNAVDPGSLLYGVAHPGFSDHLPLRPVFGALKSRLIEVKDLAPRDRFAEVAPFPVDGPMRLGVIPMGSADGLHRIHVGRALVRGQSVPILARPSLEHTRVDLTEVPDARVGDEVVLVGRQGRAEITLAEVAARHAVEPYHVASTISPRVTRMYFRDDAPTGVVGTA